MGNLVVASSNLQSGLITVVIQLKSSSAGLARRNSTKTSIEIFSSMSMIAGMSSACLA